MADTRIGKGCNMKNKKGITLCVVIILILQIGCVFSVAAEIYQKKNSNAKNMIMYGASRYCCSQNQEKGQITITVYDKKMKKTSVSIFSEADCTNHNMIQYKNYKLQCNSMKVLNQNKVQISYTMVKKDGEHFDEGKAVLDLKNKKVIRVW